MPDAQLPDVPDDPVAEWAFVRGNNSERHRRWQLLVLDAEARTIMRDFAGARASHEQSWREAYDRDTQAATIHHAGRRWWRAGDPDQAASHFELARALRRGFSEPALTASSEQALDGARLQLGYDAIVLAGGAGRRMGGVGKPDQRIAGWPMLDHVLMAVAGAGIRIVAGPRRIGLGEPLFRREDPPGSGPVAALGAALPLIRQRTVAVLAADLPLIGPGIAQLRAALAGPDRNDASFFVDTGGRVNYLAAMWRTESLRAALARVTDGGNQPGPGRGTPVRALIEHARVVTVPDFDSLAIDCDTPAELREAEERLGWFVAARGLPEGRGLLSDASAPTLPPTPLAWPGLELHAPS